MSLSSRPFTSVTPPVLSVIVCLLIVSLPSTYLFYAAPPAAMLVLLRRSIDTRMLLLTIAGILWIAVGIFLSLLRGHSISLGGLAMFPVTHGAWLLAFTALFLARTPSRQEWLQILNIAAVWLLGQSLLGFLQFAVSRNGDMVSGTFGLTDFVDGTVTISQVMFTATTLPLSMMLALIGRSKLHRGAAAAGFCVSILAQSGHQTIFLAVSVLFVGCMCLRKLGALLTLITAVAAGAVVVSWVYPSTAVNTVAWFEKVALDRQSPKHMLGAAVMDQMQDPLTLVFGVGPGQFSSRAALFASGEYGNTRLLGPLVDPPRLTRTFIQPAVDRFRLVGETSAIAQPYSSYAALAVELGLPVSIAVIVGILGQMLRSVRLAQIHGGTFAGRFHFCIASCLMTLALCATIENYFEFVQGIAVPLLIFCLGYRGVRDAVTDGVL